MVNRFHLIIYDSQLILPKPLSNVDNLDGQEINEILLEIAKKDISDMDFINSLEGNILTVGSEIIQRWLTYFDGLLNTDNTIKLIESGVVTEASIEIFNENEVPEQLGKMGLDNATGSGDLHIEAHYYTSKTGHPVCGRGHEPFTTTRNPRNMEEEQGDILECNNYQVIKLM